MANTGRYKGRSPRSRRGHREGLVLCIGGNGVRRLEYARWPETVAAIALAVKRVNAALNLSDREREELRAEIYYRAEHVWLDPALRYHFKREDFRRFMQRGREGAAELIVAIQRLKLPERIKAILQDQARAFIAGFESEAALVQV